MRVLDEAVRDDVLASNPARNRSRRSLGKSALIVPVEQTSPRAHALPNLATLNRLAQACGRVHQSYSDFVMLSALLASRGIEFTNLDGWHNLDDAEKALGQAAGRERIKLVPREDMLRAARGE